MSEIENNEGIRIPQPEEVGKEDRENAFGAYIMMFAGAYFPLPFVEIISSIIYFTYYKKRSRYVSFHAYQSLLGQIPVTIINTLMVIWGIAAGIIGSMNSYLSPLHLGLLVGFIILGVIVNIIYIILSLVIGFKAKKGIISYMPLVGRAAYEKLYGKNAIGIGPEDQGLQRNAPPA